MESPQEQEIVLENTIREIFDEIRENTINRIMTIEYDFSSEEEENEIAKAYLTTIIE